MYDTKLNNSFNAQPISMPRGDKNTANDYRPVSNSQNMIPNSGFSYFN